MLNFQHVAGDPDHISLWVLKEPKKSSKTDAWQGQNLHKTEKRPNMKGCQEGFDPRAAI